VSPTAPAQTRCPPGQWATDTDNYRAWWHDCSPFGGTHFTVYSDGSSLQAKTTLAGIAETEFAETTREFGILSEAELDFTPGYTYYIFAEKTVSPMAFEGYRNGFLAPAIDREPAPGPYHNNPDHYRRTVRHEISHVFQFTLTGCPRNRACPSWLHVWFREGQAVFISGTHSIPGLAEYRAWVADPAHVNPIRIRDSPDFPDASTVSQYYPLFGLVYAYLTDPARGRGATMQDVRGMFQHMKEGEAFTVAFERTFGLSTAFLEEHFYTLMETYLAR
jgi:hypothetical protein